MSNEATKSFFNGFLLMLLSIGFVWSKSTFEKLSSGNFANILGDTLNKFASKNPYSWYRSFLENTAIPNATFFGTLVLLGEFFVAISIVVSITFLLIKPQGNKNIEILLLLGLVGGMFLNINFYLASGWMSPSSAGINILMFLIELIGVIYIFRNY